MSTSAACNVLITMMWDEVTKNSLCGNLSSKIQLFTKSHAWSLVAAFFLILVMEIGAIAQLTFHLIPMPISTYTIITSSISIFVCFVFGSKLLWSSYKLFRAVQVIKSVSESSVETETQTETHARTNAFLRRIAVAGTMNACSSIMLVLLFLVSGMFNIFFRSPASFLTTAVLASLTRATLIIGQIMFCFPPKHLRRPIISTSIVPSRISHFKIDASNMRSLASTSPQANSES